MASAWNSIEQDPLNQITQSMLHQVIFTPQDNISTLKATVESINSGSSVEASTDTFFVCLQEIQANEALNRWTRQHSVSNTAKSLCV
jgi:hypothetical protein